MAALMRRSRPPAMRPSWAVLTLQRQSNRPAAKDSLRAQLFLLTRSKAEGFFPNSGPIFMPGLMQWDPQGLGLACIAPGSLPKSLLRFRLLPLKTFGKMLEQES